MREDAISLQEEEEKITLLCNEVLGRVSVEGESVKSKSKVEFKKLDEELASSRENIKNDSLVLCTELDKVSDLVKGGEESKFDTAACWDKVKSILSANRDSQLNECSPTFHPSKTLAKVKSADLGYINIAVFHPHQYQLSLTNPMHNIIEAGINKKVICTVLPTELFTDLIQANIKFSIKNKVCKEAVPYCKEECKLSSDKKSFQIAFLTTAPGTYVVTVLLYDQHVVDSPLSLIVSEPHISENKDKFDQQTASQVESPKDYENNVKMVISEKPTDNSSNHVYKDKDTGSAVPAETKSKSVASKEPPISIQSAVSPVAKLTRSDLLASTSSSTKLIPTKLRRPSPTVSAQDADSSSIMSVLPPGALDLSPLAPGSGLAGLRMLSIEEGVKLESLQ